MDIKKIIDAPFQFCYDNPNAKEEEVKLHVCECLLSELRQANATDLAAHLQNVVLEKRKEERQVLVNLSFLWKVSPPDSV